MIRFFSKIFLPFKVAGGYAIVLTLFVVGVSAFVYSGGFLDLPLIFIFLPPFPAIITLPITIVICWFIASLLIKLQRKILPNKERLFTYSIIIILVLIIFIFSVPVYATRIIKIIPTSQICWIADNWDNWAPSNKYEGTKCYTALAIKKNDLDLCGDLNYEFLREGCYVQMAIFNNDITICEKYIHKVPNYIYPDTNINDCKKRVQRGK